MTNGCAQDRSGGTVADSKFAPYATKVAAGTSLAVELDYQTQGPLLQVVKVPHLTGAYNASAVKCAHMLFRMGRRQARMCNVGPFLRHAPTACTVRYLRRSANTERQTKANVSLTTACFSSQIVELQTSKQDSRRFTRASMYTDPDLGQVHCLLCSLRISFMM